MENYTLNNTPIRTANNFGINDVNLELEIPRVKEFENVMIITPEMDKLEISDIFMGVSKNNVTSKIGLNINKNYGLTITVPKGNIIENPVIINCDFDDENAVLIDNIKIILEESSEAKFILRYNGEEKIESMHYLKQETIAQKNSKAKIVIANLMGEEDKSFIAIENSQKENSQVDYILVENGGNKKLSNYYSKLEENFAQNNLKTIYLGTNEDLIDINYNIELYGKNTKCDIQAMGAISGNCHKNFKGTIDFKKGCENSKGTENENCMILSDTAKSKSLPMLLCKEENVEGEHGVSSGKIDEAKLFYIMTKGISQENAKKLIVKANFSTILKEIDDEKLKSIILENIDKKL